MHAVVAEKIAVIAVVEEGAGDVDDMDPFGCCDLEDLEVVLLMPVGHVLHPASEVSLDVLSVDAYGAEVEKLLGVDGRKRHQHRDASPGVNLFDDGIVYPAEIAQSGLRLMFAVDILGYRLPVHVAVVAAELEDYIVAGADLVEVALEVFLAGRDIAAEACEIDNLPV